MGNIDYFRNTKGDDSDQEISSDGNYKNEYEDIKNDHNILRYGDFNIKMEGDYLFELLDNIENKIRETNKEIMENNNEPYLMERKEENIIDNIKVGETKLLEARKFIDSMDFTKKRFYSSFNRYFQELNETNKNLLKLINTSKVIDEDKEME